MKSIEFTEFQDCCYDSFIECGNFSSFARQFKYVIFTYCKERILMDSYDPYYVTLRCIETGISAKYNTSEFVRFVDDCAIELSKLRYGNVSSIEHNPKPFKSTASIKVYHVRQADVHHEILKGSSNTYNKCKRFWGNLVIFERELRTWSKYAKLFDIKGRIAHTLTEDTFKRLMEVSRVEHIYDRGLTDSDMLRLQNLYKS